MKRFQHIQDQVITFKDGRWVSKVRGVSRSWIFHKNHNRIVYRVQRVSRSWIFHKNHGKSVYRVRRVSRSQIFHKNHERSVYRVQRVSRSQIFYKNHERSVYRMRRVSRSLIFHENHSVYMVMSVQAPGHGYFIQNMSDGEKRRVCFMKNTVILTKHQCYYSTFL